MQPKHRLLKSDVWATHKNFNTKHSIQYDKAVRMADSRSAAGPGEFPPCAAHLACADHHPVRPGSACPRSVASMPVRWSSWVSARAVDGKANEAALAPVAAASGVRRGDVRLVAEGSGRTKVLEVADGDPRILADLLHHT